MRAFLIAVAMMLSSSFAFANQESVHSRAHALYQELRCAVCEGQSLAESDAQLAVDMRALVKKKIEAGQSDQEILAFFADKYGDEILMRPPLKAHTTPLWLTPFILLMIGAVLLMSFYKTRRNPENSESL